MNRLGVLRRLRRRPGAAAAAQLTDGADWETLAAWSGGHLRNREIADSGEQETELVLPDGRVAVEGDWLIRTAGGMVIAGDAGAAGPWDCDPSVETMLREMHARFRLHGGWMPTHPTANLPDGLMDARWALISEEVNTELRAAMMAGDLVGIADGIADAVVTLAGTAVVCGLPFDALVREVHISNMTKSNDPASPKLIKGPGYEPPRIAELIAEAAGLGAEI